MRCDAGKGCAIDCPGDCVAVWDTELNVCETRCLAAKVSPKALILKKGRRYSVSLHAGNGRQARALFAPYLPDDLARALDRHEDRVDFDIRDGTVDDLLAELGQMLGDLQGKS
jgi:hypothetical protein